ncbi:uncharacterized protein LOC132286281 isoform X1 [Cornus florida]|uniref:uncharacterized protein LOC132286281 isoform X1 n=1 Tax=Cornus florida TaxID=4283 RepID=UPI00289B2379|nr:uncharacterized protein LOC132286281 isoform X1 [Cornus florida]
MDDPKLLVVAIDGDMQEFSFAQKGLQVTWETVINDIINSDYCFAFEVRDSYYYNAKKDKKVAVLKFQASRKCAFIYGCGTTNYDIKYRVCLDESELNPISTATEVNVGSLTCYLLCLPNEIKLKIVESLDGVDLAKFGCVCSEFRNLASDECLWKQKFLLEFSDKVKERAEGESLWKHQFAEAWREKKFHSRILVVPTAARCNPLYSKKYCKFVLKNLKRHG